MFSVFPVPRKRTRVIALVLFVIGCGGHPCLFDTLGAEPLSASEEGETFVHKKKDQPYTYQAGDRRDPFVPLSISQVRDDSMVPALSVSSNAEDALRVLGIISGKRGYQALLQLSNGDRLMVGSGSRLENMSLTVKRITDNSIIVAQALEGKGDSRILERTLYLSH